MAVNVFSYVHLATLAMPALARSGTEDPTHGGQLVVVTSAAGKLGAWVFLLACMSFFFLCFVHFFVSHSSTDAFCRSA